MQEQHNAPKLLNYTYRCYPTDAQERWLGESANQCRRWWNDLIGRQKQAHRQIVSGHEEHTRARLASLLGTKKPTGLRAAKLNKLAEDLGQDGALKAIEQQDQHNLSRARGAGLEVAFAIAVVTDIRARDTGGHLGAVFAQLVARFRRTWQEVWRTAKVPDERHCGPPRFKKRRDTMPITRQWQQDWAWIEREAKRYVDITAFLPRRVEEGTELEVEVHRPLPKSAKVKELKIKRLSSRWELILTIEVDAAEYYQDRGPNEGRVCGIDPGRKTAATVASLDGTDTRKLSPGKPLRQAARRLEVLQRRFARQQRRNNPDCFRADGTWIKGRRRQNISGRMRRTLLQIRQLHQKTADIRKTYWGQETARLVREYDQIYVGDWTPPTPKSKGERKAARQAKYRERQEQRKRGAASSERGRNKSDTDNSLGDFRRQLAERISRSAALRKMGIVREPNTTRMCSGCGALTGPTGQEGLAIRRWTCTACGHDQDRDIASAINIARRGMETDAKLVSAEPSTSQKARIAKARREPSRPRNSPKVSDSCASVQMAQQMQGPLASYQLANSQAVGACEVHAAGGKPQAQPSPLARASGSPTIDSG